MTSERLSPTYPLKVLFGKSRVVVILDGIAPHALRRVIKVNVETLPGCKRWCHHPEFRTFN
jgi:hypothetical protein